MTYFCVVIGCKTVKIDEEQALKLNKKCPVHGAELKKSARPVELRHAMPVGATPNVIEAVSGTLSQSQRSLPTPDTIAALPSSVSASLPTSQPRPSFAEIMAKRPSAPTGQQNSSTSSSSPEPATLTGGFTYGALGTFPCRSCGQRAGGARHLASLPESKATRDRAARFVAACETWRGKASAYKGSERVPVGYMVGVLQRGSRFYIAISGTDNCMPQGAKRIAKKLGLAVVDKVPGAVTASGEAIDTSQLTKTGVGNFFECAGPKLVGYVLAEWGAPDDTGWFLTEMWCGPSTRNEHVSAQVYESCGNCRQILPMMLCQGGASNASGRDASSSRPSHSTPKGGQKPAAFIK